MSAYEEFLGTKRGRRNKARRAELYKQAVQAFLQEGGQPLKEVFDEAHPAMAHFKIDRFELALKGKALGRKTRNV